MKKNIFIFIFIFSIFSLFLARAGNDISDFSRLKSNGELPTQLKNRSNSDDPGTKYLFSLAEKGLLLYGNELNKYVENIADILLKNDPKIRKQLNFYIVKSPEVNAVILKNGAVLINIGLLAQITNESELAFILGHEIIHFTEHVKKYENDKTKITSLNNYIAYQQNSREDELEADKLSLERYFIKSPYSLEALNNVFDVLMFGYLPFDEIPFPRTEVETEFFKFPDNYFLQNVKEIRNRNDFIDTLSTHPNIKKRQQFLENFLEKNIDNGKTFVQDEILFIKIKNLARFECINSYLTIHDYDNAIYNIFVLKKQFPNNKFLEIAEAAAYYGFHKHKTNGNISNVLQEYKKVEGEKQQIAYFLQKINKKEANLFAIRKLYDVFQKNKTNKFVEKMIDDCFYDLIKENNMLLTDFSDYAENEIIDTLSVQNQTPDTTEYKDKYSRIKNKKQTFVYPNIKFKTVNYMLVDLKRESLFISLFENSRSKIEDEEQLKIAAVGKPILKKNDKILVWMPTYEAIYSNESNKKPKLNNKVLKSAINKSLKSLKIENEIISENYFDKFNTEKFNQIATIGSWMVDLNQTDFSRMQLYQSQWFNEEMLKSGFQYLNLVTENSEKAKFLTGYKYNIIYRAPLCWPTLPIDLIFFFLPNRDKNINFYLYDIQNREIVVSSNYNTENIDATAYIHKNLYDTYYLIKNGKKIKIK
ncbi:MAG: M48 family metallopeptidase [Bacteroidales bacterium]|jgi:Zn-dependent protease with chaperone function|nr:M48 family metallopeptidase [Bacteroidales bacterium]